MNTAPSWAPMNRIRSARSVSSTDEWIEVQTQELLEHRVTIDRDAFQKIEQANAQIAELLADRSRWQLTVDDLLAELAGHEGERPIIVRDDSTGPRTDVFHYLDGGCTKRPTEGWVMFESQAPTRLRPANCRCRRR